MSHLAVHESESVSDRRFLRAVLVIAQAATLWITWPLWQTRAFPPNLPLFGGLPQADVGPLLCVTLSLILFRPRLGVLLHSLTLMVAISMDQMRIQPQFVSMTLLVWATLPSRSAVLIGRTHLGALYLYGGLHKLLGTYYREQTGPAFWRELLPDAAHDFANELAWLLAIAEALAGLALLWPRVRPALAWMLCALHVGILGGLMLFMQGRNPAVWPWNLALAVAAPSLILRWRAPALSELKGARPVLVVTCALMLMTPALYRVGWMDAYLSWCLYADTPRAVYVTATQLEKLEEVGRPAAQMPALNTMSTQELHVPFPPAHRLYEDWFRAVAAPGDALLVHDPRPYLVSRQRDARVLTMGGHVAHVILEGEWLDYHPNGTLASVGQARQGVKHGPWTTFHSDGSRRSAGAYADGQRVGVWTTWMPNGPARHTDYGHASSGP